MARTGRYSHQLLTSEFYQKKAPHLWSWSTELEQQGYDEPTFVSAWILGVGIAAKGFELLQPHASYQLISGDRMKHLAGGPTLESLVESLSRHQAIVSDLSPWRKHESLLKQDIWATVNVCELRGLPRAVRHCLLQWKLGNYPLKLFRHHLSGEDVFQMQKNFRRCVAVFRDIQDLKGIHHGRDAWAFTIHDLIHAEHFYQNPLSAQQQVGFLQWVEKIRIHQGFENLFQDPQFKDQFQYLISDMNAYCGHLVKTLHALIVQSKDRLALAGANLELPHWNCLIENTVEVQEAQSALLKINTPDFAVEDFQHIEGYFMKTCLI